MIDAFGDRGRPNVRAEAEGGGQVGRLILAALFWILASVLQPSSVNSQTYDYVPNVAALATTLTSGAVTLGGYYNVSDGGGGMLIPGASGCTPNNSTIFIDSGGNCLYRATTTNNVREWGAMCDVVAVQSTSSANAVWKPALGAHGAVQVDTSLIAASPPVSTGGQYIVISQIGGPTLFGTGTPAVWATRNSQVTTKGVNYKPGDLISFMSGSVSMNYGSFSQQLAIIVDAVDSMGGITQWHFLWGGLYDPTAAMDATFTQDDSHSVCANQCGTTSGYANGAIFTPAWSGWSLLNSQKIGTGTQSGYLPGDTITLDGTGSTVNQSHYPKLVVEQTSGGAVTAFDWLDYGSYSTLPTNPMLLSQTATMRGGVAGPGTGFTLSPVAWTRGPLATKIDHTSASGSQTNIYLTDDSGTFPSSSPPLVIQYFYYGDDDGKYINAALSSQSVGSLASVNGSAITLPGACGTTKPIILPQDTTANFVNPALVGGNLQSTGLYALALPPGLRTSSLPIMNRVVYGGVAGALGGGISNMLIEASGIPEGFGYHGMYPAFANLPSGYVGPTAIPFNIPSAGDAIEIDSGKYLKISNLHVTDGGIGSGNSIVHCGIDEANADGAIAVGPTGNWIVSDSRFDGNSALSGATNPDFALRLGNSCHDSVYKALSVYDGTKADVLTYNGNLFGQMHLNSDAANAGARLASFTWNAYNTGLAGVADFGVLALGNTSLQQTQCDIANSACVRLLGASANANGNPGQITDTQMKCGALLSVPSTYFGVWVGAGTTNTTISGTATPAGCNVPGTQLVQFDGPIDPTVSLCNNSNATVVSCGGGSGLAAGRYYTQPSLAYTTVTVSGAPSPATTTIYAVPFVNPSGGAITQIGIDVQSAVAATHCDMGIYSSVAGAPASLLLDAGQVPTNATGPATKTVSSFVLQPNTLYFLAVGCQGNVGLEGTAFGSGLTGVLFGLTDFVTAPNRNIINNTWVYASGTLPTSFGTPIYSNATASGVPNVYVGP